MAVCLLLCLIFFPAGSASSGASFQAKTTYTRDSAVFLKQGILLLQKKRFAEAREEFLRAVQADSDSAEAFFYLSIAERDLGHLSAAESDLRRSLDLNPNSQNALYNLGVLLLESKKPVEAANFLERAEKIGPDSPEISANLVRAYLEAGREDEALRFAESSARQFGHLPAFDLAIGKTFLSRNLLKSARIFLGRAHQLLPSEPGILFPLAEVCLRQKDVTCVIKRFPIFRATRKTLAPITICSRANISFLAKTFLPFRKSKGLRNSSRRILPTCSSWEDFIKNSAGSRKL